MSLFRIFRVIGCVSASLLLCGCALRGIGGDTGNDRADLPRLESGRDWRELEGRRVKAEGKVEQFKGYSWLRVGNRRVGLGASLPGAMDARRIEVTGVYGVRRLEKTAGLTKFLDSLGIEETKVNEQPRFHELDDVYYRVRKLAGDANDRELSRLLRKIERAVRSEQDLADADEGLNDNR